MTVKCPKGTTYKLVTCNKPTKPPYTGEKNPGRCSRVRGFCVPPTPNWTCWQHGRDYVTIKNPRNFKDCADAVKTFAAQAKAKKYEASTQPFLTYSSSSTTVTPKNGRYTATTNLRWSVDASQTTVTLPGIHWPNMTAADKAAVRAAVQALRAHEEGHVAQATSYAAELSGGSGDAVSGTGRTAQAARDSLQRRLAARGRQVVAELNKRNNAYDKKTQHGVKQSAVGGTDVKLICP